MALHIFITVLTYAASAFIACIIIGALSNLFIFSIALCGYIIYLCTNRLFIMCLVPVAVFILLLH